jgi:hypothetical protein
MQERARDTVTAFGGLEIYSLVRARARARARRVRIGVKSVRIGRVEPRTTRSSFISAPTLLRHGNSSGVDAHARVRILDMAEEVRDAP